LTAEAQQVSHFRIIVLNVVKKRVLADDGKTVIGEVSLERRILFNQKKFHENETGVLAIRCPFLPARRSDRSAGRRGVDDITRSKKEGGSTITQTTGQKNTCTIDRTDVDQKS